MVSTRLVVMALVVVWCCSMTASEQHLKWYNKPYAWMSSPKSYSPSHPAVYGKPLPRPYIPPGHDKHRDRCELRKAVFTQDADSPQVSEPLDITCPRTCDSGDFDGFPVDRYRLQLYIIDTYFVCSQYIIYKTKIPDLKEFTLCHWHNIFNYTHDQPIFSYTRKYTTKIRPRQCSPADDIDRVHCVIFIRFSVYYGKKCVLLCHAVAFFCRRRGCTRHFFNITFDFFISTPTVSRSTAATKRSP